MAILAVLLCQVAAGQQAISLSLLKHPRRPPCRPASQPVGRAATRAPAELAGQRHGPLANEDRVADRPTGLNASTPSPGGQGLRVVDLVDLTDPKSETSHAYAGEQTTEGVLAGRKWRAAAGWFSYDVKIYDDSALTLVCVFRGSQGRRQAFDVLVDDGKVVTRTFESPTAEPVEVAFVVPEALTLGKVNVTVKFRAQPGSVTAALIELRTVQEHLESPRLPRSR